LRYVRDTALSALPQQPDLAEVLAYLAIQQAEVSRDVEEARRQLLAAYCLLAAVRRLRRHPDEADALLNRAAFLLHSVDDQSLFLRTLALLRWEQGRPDEAHTLLARAVELRKGKSSASSDTALSQLLLGLLHLLEGVAVDRPLARLRLASASLDAAHQPFPALLARLSLAYALALAGDLDAAASQRHSAQELFPLLTEGAAAAYAGWLDARVSVITSPEGGLERLLFARQELLLRKLPLAATLATVDGVHYLAASDHHDLIPAFLVDAPLPLQLPPVLNLCQDLAELPKGSSFRRATLQANLRRDLVRLPSVLRRVCLLRGIDTEPLPFV
jgi:tetratricopeptide (TPR) repeat protein